MKKVIVEFETVTPLWTGDAWGECKEIKPSAIMGSLRFWFEVIMYFAGILEKKDFNSQSGRFEKEVDRGKLQDFLVKNGNSFEVQIQALLEQEVPISSIVFGTTNWKSLIEIKKIEPIEDYCFGNRLNLLNKICIDKASFEIKKENECSSKSNQDWSVFFFVKPYFYGKFKVTFLVEEQIIASIFYPLLNFMHKYGFWGGKWNIGYGRLKVKNVKENRNVKSSWQKFDFELFDNICFSWENIIRQVKLDNNVREYEVLQSILAVEDFYCKTEREFEQKISNIPKKIVFIEFNKTDNEFENIIKSLIRKKMKIRNCLRTNNNNRSWKTFRHKLLGELGEGSKILPFIYEEENQLKGGFLSVAGLLNLEGESNG